MNKIFPDKLKVLAYKANFVEIFCHCAKLCGHFSIITFPQYSHLYCCSIARKNSQRCIIMMPEGCQMCLDPPTKGLKSVTSENQCIGTESAPEGIPGI